MERGDGAFAALMQVIKAISAIYVLTLIIIVNDITP